MHGYDLDPALAAAFKNRVEELVVVKAEYLDLAVNDIDRVQFEADDAPLFNLPIELSSAFSPWSGLMPP